MKIGDRVSVLDDIIEGEITSIIENTVFIKDDHGFTYHYDKKFLVPKTPDLYDKTPIIKKVELPKKTSKKHQKNHLVCDLHFHLLVNNPSDYDGLERLFLQKNKLIETIEFCRKNNLKKLEIVHGIGDGILQKMVKEQLESLTGLDFYHQEILHHQSGSILVEFH